MELVFIRHGHGEHLKDYPHQLNTLHPGLTVYGVHQVIELRKHLVFSEDDLIVVSPTKRTIQTAEILMQSNKFSVSPCIGPRMFPLLPEQAELLCDRIYNLTEIEATHGGIETVDLGLNLWDHGINRIDYGVFEQIAGKFLSWCSQRAKRTFIVSHDGTITNYRCYLGEKDLTRADFLGEAGVYTTRLEEI